ncbi:lupus La protein, partial [Tanacetum coccineum]
WPTDWNTRYPPLANINVPQLNKHVDVLRWKDVEGMFRPFSTLYPCHATHMWLVMKRRLKTQDCLRPWDVGEDVDLTSLCCPLCKVEQDSHDHLFFACNFSSQVWNIVVNKVDLPIGSHIWSDILGWILPIARKNNAIYIVGRLILAASSYYIWQERNIRIHANGARSAEQVASVILDIVRLKLGTIKFKRNPRVAKLKATWNLPID